MDLKGIWRANMLELVSYSLLPGNIILWGAELAGLPGLYIESYMLSSVFSLRHGPKERLHQSDSPYTRFKNGRKPHAFKNLLVQEERGDRISSSLAISTILLYIPFSNLA